MWILPSDLTAARLARERLGVACAGMSTMKVDVARLLVTELVANAVLHGSGVVILVVARDGEGVRVSVDDESPDPPVVVESRSLMEHGSGMRLVAALADSWGVDQRGDGQPGKRVWFELV
jgi:anti-sigma regulatory factor (Ser/Thr protein kinase)